MKIILILEIAMIILGCTHPKAHKNDMNGSPQLDKTNIEMPYIKMVFRTTYNCTHIITLNSNGKGSLIAGSDSLEKLEIDRQDTFFVNSEGVLDSINLVIANLGDSVFMRGKYAKDVVLNFKLYVKNELKIDTYGNMNSIEFRELYSLIHPYLPFKIDFYCNGFLVK